MDDRYPSLIANWSYPTPIRFGPGRIAELAEAVKSAGMTRPLFVTDPGLVNLPITANALDILKNANIPAKVFSEVDGNPTLKNLEDGLAAYRAGGHDGVIAFGGGSGMDVGKLIAFMSGQTRPVWDFEDREDWWTRANADGIAPIVAVPTTSGTGSEVGRAAVVTDPGDHTKKIIFHPKMLPCVVIADPELTLDLPAKITAWTGMDALSHSLEAWCSPFFHPLGQGIALEAMRLCKEWLPAAVEDGHSVSGRAFMMAASSMGAVAFQKGLGAMHAMSHPCSSLRGTHHGLTNAVVMPYVLVHNARVCEGRLASLARYLDLPGAFVRQRRRMGAGPAQAHRHSAHPQGDRRRYRHHPRGVEDGRTRSLQRRQSDPVHRQGLRGPLRQGDCRRAVISPLSQQQGA